MNGYFVEDDLMQGTCHDTGAYINEFIWLRIS